MSVTVETHGKLFVLDVCHTPKTYGLGRVQRDILTYLATAPGGFVGGISCNPETRKITGHDEPYGVTVDIIARKVYATDSPTAPQIRAIQRAVRRLEELGHVDCWHGCTRIERRYTTALGFDGLVPVSALFVAARWECVHLDERRREAEEYAERQRCKDGEHKARLDAMFAKDPVGTLASLLNEL